MLNSLSLKTGQQAVRDYYHASCQEVASLRKEYWVGKDLLHENTNLDD